MILWVRILAVSGSLQAQSSNRALLRTAQRVAPAGVEVLDALSAGEIPPFNPDVERDGPAPAPVVTWRAEVAAADGGVLIASPEYAHSLPGSLKNALDWLVGSGELYGRKVAVLCGSPRSGCGARGRTALEQTLRAQGAEVVVSATVVIVAGDKGAEEIGDPHAVEVVVGALRALSGRSG